MLNELWFLYDSFLGGHYRFFFVVKPSLPSTQTENCIFIPYSLFLPKQGDLYFPSESFAESLHMSYSSYMLDLRQDMFDK